MKEENKPFNDVIDHINKIEGNAADITKDSVKKLPKPLKYFGYFLAGFLSISILLMIILNLLH
ncbi:amino acid transporter [Neobacillus sp. WH10]|uniref:amino acid transporter n=1 Tax=Neobacillus sp. WH10 TaxID=3047873 RepID=UPI0024C1464A|nr:amino acid transporter [Neobacillus sp. WH10]WHY75159.1 amino acid transporter [Neobacillus sp. WH10]